MWTMHEILNTKTLKTLSTLYEIMLRSVTSSYEHFKQTSDNEQLHP